MAWSGSWRAARVIGSVSMRSRSGSTTVFITEEMPPILTFCLLAQTLAVCFLSGGCRIGSAHEAANRSLQSKKRKKWRKSAISQVSFSSFFLGFLHLFCIFWGGERRGGGSPAFFHNAVLPVVCGGVHLRVCVCVWAACESQACSCFVCCGMNSLSRQGRSRTERGVSSALRMHVRGRRAGKGKRGITEATGVSVLVGIGHSMFCSLLSSVLIRATFALASGTQQEGQGGGRKEGNWGGGGTPRYRTDKRTTEKHVRAVPVEAPRPNNATGVVGNSGSRVCRWGCVLGVRRD